LMSILRFPSNQSTQAVNAYAKNRLVSYGSFIGAYRQAYGVDLGTFDALPSDVKRHLDDGIMASVDTSKPAIRGRGKSGHRGQRPSECVVARPCRTEQATFSGVLR